MTKFNYRINHRNHECIKSSILQIGITIGITQKGITQTGIAQIGVTQTAITQKGITQTGITSNRHDTNIRLSLLLK